MQEDTILKISDLSKTFFNTDRTSETVIEKLSLEVKRREFLCILGPSGCGKTTLLRCIAGFEDFEGTVEVDGQVKTAPGIDRIMVFQDFNQLFPWKTVEKNIQYPLRKTGIKDKARLRELTQRYLAKVNLSGVEKKYPHQLSGGMKQRVAIARALALKPKIILMDEPFAALDAMTRNKLQEELIQISGQEDCTFIFITHNIQEAIVLGSRIVLLGQNGRIKVDEANTIPRPVTPASRGYGQVWQRLHDALSDG